MKIKFNREELNNIILASGFMSGTVWFTNAIGIKVLGGYCYIYINNVQEYYLQKFKPQYEIEDGELAIDGKMLKSIISKTKGDLEIVESGEDVVIKSNGVKFKIKKFHYADLMKRWENKSEEYISIPKEGLLKGIDTQFALAKKHVKIILTGLSLILKDNYIEFCSTNELRLASYRTSLEHGVDKQIIIPNDFLNKIKAICNSGDYDISLSVDAGKCYMKFTKDDEVILISSLTLQGTYPAYQGLFTEKHQFGLSLNCQEIMDAYSNLSVLLTPEDYVNVHIEEDTVKFEYKGKNGEIESTLTGDIKCDQQSRTMDQSFFNIVKFMISVGCKEVGITRKTRIIFFDCGLEEYNFMSAVMDYKAPEVK